MKAEKLKQFSVRLPASKGRAFKAKLAAQGKTVQEVLQAAIDQFLSQSELP